ncbi:MAG: hypothetical protein ACRCV9_12865 [Burkholderiaceae bacterium]
MKTQLIATAFATCFATAAFAGPGDPVMNFEGNATLNTKINAELTNGRQGMKGGLDVDVKAVGVSATMEAFSTKSGSQIVGAIAQEGGGVINFKKDVTISGEINKELKNNQGETQVVNAIYQRGASSINGNK